MSPSSSTSSAASSTVSPPRALDRTAVRNLSLAGALAAIWLFFAFTQPVFLSPRNLSLLLIELSVTAGLALGMLLVLLPGQIDLSAGSGVGLCGALAAVLISRFDVAAPLALLAATLFALAVWAAMGVLIARERIPAFIITLGGLLAFKGLHWLVIANQTVPIARGGEDNLYTALTTYYLPLPAGIALGLLVFAGVAVARLRDRQARQRYGLSADDKTSLFLKVFVTGQLIALMLIITSQYRGLPLAAVVLGALALGVHVLTRHTPFGRYLYAIGSNEEAALISGVPILASVVGAFALMGGIVALTGFLQTAYSGASTSTVGSLMELDAVAACVIGGTSLRGGRGAVLGVLFGALMMTSLLNGMTLMAVAPETKLIARGAVLALAVWLDVRMGRG